MNANHIILNTKASVIQKKKKAHLEVNMLFLAHATTCLDYRSIYFSLAATDKVAVGEAHQNNLPVFVSFIQCGELKKRTCFEWQQ